MPLTPRCPGNGYKVSVTDPSVMQRVTQECSPAPEDPGKYCCPFDVAFSPGIRRYSSRTGDPPGKLALAFAPVTGFIWGGLIGAVLAKSGHRMDTGIEAGIWAGLTNLAMKLPLTNLGIWRNESMKTMLSLPVPTALAAYIGISSRKNKKTLLPVIYSGKK